MELTNINPHHIDAKILADSITPDGKRLTTFEVRMPRIIHAEFIRHRCLSFGFESSRAVPVKKLRAEVWNDPFMPVYWGANQSGMSAEKELTGRRLKLAKFVWRSLSKLAVFGSWCFEKIGLHKQLANRILEPWLSVSGVVSGTEWDNFFNLRLAPSAQPEIQALARKMKDAMNASTPTQLEAGEAHLPYIDEADRQKHDLWELVKIATARCCRVSYHRHGKLSDDTQADIALHDKLIASKHWSPLEAIAFVPPETVTGAFIKKEQRNYRGWIQYRALVEDGTLEKFKNALTKEEE